MPKIGEKSVSWPDMVDGERAILNRGVLMKTFSPTLETAIAPKIDANYWGQLRRRDALGAMTKIRTIPIQHQADLTPAP